jgi:hypothetical protein
LISAKCSPAATRYRVGLAHSFVVATAWTIVVASPTSSPQHSFGESRRACSIIDASAAGSMRMAVTG